MPFFKVIFPYLSVLMVMVKSVQLGCDLTGKVKAYDSHNFHIYETIQ